VLSRRVSVARDESEVPLVELSQICVVDDDRAFRDSLRRLLKSLAYSVEVFPSAATFLSFPSRSSSACLIADIQMPDMTGIELFEHLVETDQAIPTILVTAYPDERVRERMLTRGVRCYLRKPLEEATLIDCLRSALEQRKAP
jgi:FixJ family two-component response regulator